MSERHPFGGADAVLAFAPGSLEARALAVLHGHDDGSLCPVCLLAWVARVAGAPGATGASVLEALGAAVHREHGTVPGVAFEALAWGEHGSAWADAEGFRARFQALEETLHTRRLADLPTPPAPLAH